MSVEAVSGQSVACHADVQTVHIDDLSRNFAMNPGEGLKVGLNEHYAHPIIRSCLVRFVHSKARALRRGPMTTNCSNLDHTYVLSPYHSPAMPQFDRAAQTHRPNLRRLHNIGSCGEWYLANGEVVVG